MKKVLLFGIVALFLVALPSVMGACLTGGYYPYGCTGFGCTTLTATCTCESYSDPGCADPECLYLHKLTNFTFNPCVTRNINYSSTISVTVYASSLERWFSTGWYATYNDWCHAISYRFIMDYGEPTADDTGWLSSNYRSYQKNWSASTIGDGDHTLALMVKYVEGDWDVSLINFTIMPSTNNDAENVVYGDCESYYGSDTDNLANNALYISGGISDYWNRGIIWAIIMMCALGASWVGLYKVKGINTNIKVTIIALIALFLLLIGSMARMISWVYIGVIFTGVAVYFGIKIAKVITGGGER